MVVKFSEEFLFSLLATDRGVLHQSVTHVVCSHSVQQKLIMCCVVFRLLEFVANEVPEGI